MIKATIDNDGFITGFYAGKLKAPVDAIEIPSEDYHSHLNGNERKYTNGSWVSHTAKLNRENVLNSLKSSVDKKVADMRKTLYLHSDGHRYYPDEDTITKKSVILPYVELGWTINFKTADLEEDGVNNIKVLMDIAAFTQFALGLDKRQSDYWYEGERLKEAVKSLYLNNGITTEQLNGFNIKTEWSI